MTENEYQDWVVKYTPFHSSMDEFIDRLAIGTIALIQHSSKSMNVSIPEIIERFYYSDSSLDS